MLTRPLLQRLLGPEGRHAPGRIAVALVAVALGVALAWSVHLINASALAEFAQAVRAVNGDADLELRGEQAGGVPEALYSRAALTEGVALASPVVEARTQAWPGAIAGAPPADRPRAVSLTVLGIDALIAPQLAPDLWPRPGGATGDGRTLEALDPDTAFLNPAARRALGPVERVDLLVGGRLQSLAIGGDVTLPGPPTLVMDIAGAQVRWGRPGVIDRIDLRLADGTDRPTLLAALALPPGVRAASPDERATRLSNLSRAYRVNLTVLALVALFTGGFLVFSVQSLAVARRLPQLALLGVLGLDARARRRLVLIESAALGVVGAGLGLALGTALAWAALRLLGGDLGGGYFSGLAPPLRWNTTAALLHAGLGLIAALAGGWLPARLAEQLAPAQSLKGLGQASTAPTGRAARWQRRGPLILLALAPVLALLPPPGELPLPAYAAVAALLFGGIAAVPMLVELVLRHVAPPREPVWLLAVERARDQRHTATVAVAGVVASLALSVALTVMVASFRDSVGDWLDRVLPADLYLRLTGGGEGALLPEPFIAAVQALPGVREVRAQRVLNLTLDARQPPVVLMARALGDFGRSLPLAGTPAGPGPADLPEVHVSEALVDLYGAHPGTTLDLPLPVVDGPPRRQRVFVRSVWRDYARQHGSLVIERSRWEALTGDTRSNDLALWLQPDAPSAAVMTEAIRTAARRHLGAAELLDVATPGEIRATSLRIFDRSFAVTYWLQAVAIGIGLFGVAASFSAQVLSRQREFGALQHLGFARRDVLRLVLTEGLLWTAFGAAVGLALGLAIAVILVHVVNPQSFHWTMDLSLPAGRLLGLCLAVLVAGAATAWIAGRAAAGRRMALSVKEDW